MIGISGSRMFGWAAAITALNVAVASGFAIAGLVWPGLILAPGQTASPATAVFAMYAAARTLPLAAFVVTAIIRRSTSALLLLGALAGVIQILDAVVGWNERDLGKTAGPLLIAAFQFASLIALRGESRQAARPRGIAPEPCGHNQTL
jgi:hypothetical protein